MNLKFFFKVMPILFLFLWCDFSVAQRRGGRALLRANGIGSSPRSRGSVGDRAIAPRRTSFAGKIGPRVGARATFAPRGTGLGAQRIMARPDLQSRRAAPRTFVKSGLRQRGGLTAATRAGTARRDFGLRRGDLTARTFRRRLDTGITPRFDRTRLRAGRPLADRRRIADRTKGRMPLRDRRMVDTRRRLDRRQLSDRRVITDRRRFAFKDRALRDRRLSLSRSLTSNRFRRFRSPDRLQRQRGFLSKHFRGRPWSWWWRHNRGYFYRYFPTYFYDFYGYYPPIYYDYYELYGYYPTQVYSTAIIEPDYGYLDDSQIIATDSLYNGAEIGAANCFLCNRECVKNCLNNTNLSLEECCNEQCLE